MANEAAPTLAEVPAPVGQELINRDIIEALEVALEHARRGEFLDIAIVGRMHGEGPSNVFFHRWSRTMDFVSRLGTLEMIKFDIQDRVAR